MKYKNKSLTENHPIITGVISGGAKFAAMKAVSEVAKHHGIEMRHGRSENLRRQEFLDEHPVASALAATALAPVAEELFWRVLPSSIAERFPQHSRKVDLGAVGLFAAQHLGQDGLPVSQTVGGILYQSLYKKAGLKSSTAAHITNNSLAAIDFVRKSRQK